MCDLLTEDQIVAFDLPRTLVPHKRADTVFDCNLEQRGDERWFASYTLWLATDLLDDWYRMKDNVELRYIEGQPAVVDDMGAGWDCNLAVRLAERKTLQLIVTDRRRDDVDCSHAIAVAEQMVRNLEG